MAEFVYLSEKYLDSLCELEQICFSIPWTKGMFEEEIKSNMTHYILCVEDKKVIGYAGLWKVIDEGQITNVAVHPDYRRQGIAVKMLLKLVNDTKPLGICKYTLEVREGNINAISLYKKIGFVQNGLRKEYYADNKENAVLMVLEV